GITSDNEPDFASSSYLVFYCMGRLWRDLGLDQLILCSYAPYQSKYNSIEIPWGNMSQALAQITLVPDAQKYNQNSRQDMKQLFTKALEELKSVWDKTKYAGFKVDCQNILPDEREAPFDDLEELKNLFEHGPKSSHYHNHKQNVKF